MTQLQFNTYYYENITAFQRFAFLLTKNRVEAEDLVQESLLKAFRYKKSFKQGTNFKSWVFTILKNTFITRYHKKSKESVVNAPIEDFNYTLSSSYTTKNDAVAKLNVAEIKDCFSSLSNKVRRPFELHINGYQYNEIAEKLEIPIGTVKSRINAARTKLKKMIQINQTNIAA